MWSGLLRVVAAAFVLIRFAWAEREGSDDAQGVLAVQPGLHEKSVDDHLATQPLVPAGAHPQQNALLQTAEVDAGRLLLDSGVVGSILGKDHTREEPLRQKNLTNHEHSPRKASAAATDVEPAKKLPGQVDTTFAIAGSSLAASVTPAIRALIQSADQQRAFKDVLPMNAFVVDDAGHGRTSASLDRSSPVVAALGSAASSAAHFATHPESARPSSDHAQEREAGAVTEYRSSLLTTVFLAYTMLSLAAVALCAAYITHWESQKASAGPSDREIWSEVLRVGNFGDDARTLQDPKAKLGGFPAQGPAVSAKTNGIDCSTGAAPWKQVPAKAYEDGVAFCGVADGKATREPDVDHWVKVLRSTAFGVTKAPWSGWQSSLDSFLGLSLSGSPGETDSEDHRLPPMGSLMGARGGPLSPPPQSGGPRLPEQPCSTARQ